MNRRKKRKIPLNEEINNLFEKFVSEKNKRLDRFENLRRELVEKLDDRIDELYKKRDFITEIFSNEIELRKHKLSVWKKFIRTKFLVSCKFILSMPFIYIMIIPAFLLHISLEIYHQVCFRIYGIPRVNPKEYFIFDRRLLPYLNWLEKFNCFYCSYFNCLISYTQEIAGRTELFWCPIKHSMRLKNPHKHYNKFVDYSDAKSLRKEWKNLRKFDKD